MEERYFRLFTLPKNLYTQGAPVIIAAGALLKDRQKDRVVAQLKFMNISDKAIKALKLSLQAFDVYGCEVQGVDDFQYLDLSITRDTEFGQKQAIVLPNNATRSFHCMCVSLLFTDGTTWTTNGTKWAPIAEPQLLSQKLSGLAAQYQRETIDKARFVIMDTYDLWICSCGAINNKNEPICHLCHSEKSVLAAALDVDMLEKNNAKYLKVQDEQSKRQAAEVRKKRLKARNIAIVAAAAATAVIAAIVVVTQVIVPSRNYNAAVTLMNEGSYAEAASAFNQLAGYKDAELKIEKCGMLLDEKQNGEEYQTAARLFSSGDYASAAEKFKQIGGYRDAYDQYVECLYQIALQFYGAQNYPEAIDAFENVLFAIAQQENTTQSEASTTETALPIAKPESFDGFEYKDASTLLAACQLSLERAKNEYNPINIDDNDTAVQPQTGYIVADGVNLRAEPNTEAAILDVLDRSTAVEVLQSFEDWSNVKANGQTGYVKTSFVGQDALLNEDTDSHERGTNALTLTQEMLHGTWVQSWTTKNGISHYRKYVFNGNAYTYTDTINAYGIAGTEIHGSYTISGNRIRFTGSGMDVDLSAYPTIQTYEKEENISETVTEYVKDQYFKIDGYSGCFYKE